MVEVCYICGDRGFLNALLECSGCSVSSAHQYCLGIPPGSIDDNFDWVCECCTLPTGSESCRFRGSLQSCSATLKIERQPEPLCMLSPVQYDGSSTEKTSTLSQNHDAPISTYMEHPDSIMRGIVLFASPSGDVFIEEENSSSLEGQILNMIRLSENPGTYEVECKLSHPDKTVKNYVGSMETLELHERKPTNATKLTGYTFSEVDGCEENGKILKCESSSLENNSESGRFGKSFGYPEENEVTEHVVDSKADVWINESVGNLVGDIRRGMLNRALEPEVEVTQQKKATVYKVGDAEGPNYEPLENSKVKHELIDSKTDKCCTKLDRKPEPGFGTGLTQTQKWVRNQIVSMVLSAGWTVQRRPRINKSRTKTDIVYVNPEGKAFWSLSRVYRSLARDFEMAKANKSELGDGYGNSNFGFKPLSKALLNVLRRPDRRKNKQTKS